MYFVTANVWKQVRVLRGGVQGFCDNSTHALVIKCETMRRGGLIIVQNCVMSFLDDPSKNQFKGVIRIIVFFSLKTFLVRIQRED